MRCPAALVAPLLVVALITGCSPAPEAEPSERASEPAPVSMPTSAETPVTPPPILTTVPQKFRALGTEPFWSAEVEGTRLTYTTPVTQEGATISIVRKDAGKRALYTGSIGGKPLELEIWRETCSDGMSDADYPFTVIRRIGPDTQRGCAR
ncbi:putative membrane protein [Novosphingobium hassiacum]|uniref:Putative membrane protein n=2 Tax=Novosphingobium hassiacum TaxID=173676 RepID=A0A7W6EXK1_9SPHN|nr:putative membrane protein [Novosphingobium hassiacum]